MINNYTKKDITKISRFLKATFPKGEFTPKEIVNMARPTNSPIHAYFEWNNSKAAELYRIQQARGLIQCVVLVENDTEVRKYHSVYIQDKGRVYKDVNEARKAPELWEQVLRRAIQDAVSWKKRYENIKQLKSAFQAIEELEREYGYDN